MSRILLINDALIGPVMAGRGVRTWEMAKALAAEHEVVLALTRPGYPVEAPFPVLRCSTAQLIGLLKNVDVVISANIPPLLLPLLRLRGVPTVVDLYDPVIVEESARSYPSDLPRRRALPWKQTTASDTTPLPLSRVPSSRGGRVREGVKAYHERLRATLLQLRCGDFFLCANEQQRLFWLGMFSALGRLPPTLCAKDPALRQAIRVIPFGVPDEPPQHRRQVLKGIWPGIEAGDRVILWGGGIWDWTDPETLLYATAELVQNHDDVKLFFMGVGSPDPRVPRMEAGRRAIELGQELGLYDRVAFFNPAWIPYHERADYLLEADIGVSLGRPGLEDELAVRIRVLDYLWAGLPVVASAGNSASDLIAQAGAGLVVPRGDRKALQAALARLLDEPALYRRCQDQIAAQRDRWPWKKAVEPLSTYCHEPTTLPRRQGTAALWAHVLRLYLRRTWYTWRRGGWRALQEGIAANVGRRTEKRTQ
jgi:glycosyltransferase involved in cell wall biosynthesis